MTKGDNTRLSEHAAAIQSQYKWPIICDGMTDDDIRLIVSYAIAHNTQEQSQYNTEQ